MVQLYVPLFHLAYIVHLYKKRPYGGPAWGLGRRAISTTACKEMITAQTLKPRLKEEGGACSRGNKDRGRHYAGGVGLDAEAMAAAAVKAVRASPHSFHHSTSAQRDISLHQHTLVLVGTTTVNVPGQATPNLAPTKIPLHQIPQADNASGLFANRPAMNLTAGTKTDWVNRQKPFCSSPSCFTTLWSTPCVACRPAVRLTCTSTVASSGFGASFAGSSSAAKTPILVPLGVNHALGLKNPRGLLDPSPGALAAPS